MSEIKLPELNTHRDGTHDEWQAASNVKRECDELIPDRRGLLAFIEQLQVESLIRTRQLREALARIAELETALKEMTVDRDLWANEHNSDCPNADDLLEAKQRIAELEANIDDLFTQQDVNEAYASAKPKWISVQERLPEHRQHVIVYHPARGLGSGCHDNKWNYLRPWDTNLDDEAMIDGVTHWMPLPEPPSDGGAR